MEYDVITMVDPRTLRDRPNNTKVHTPEQINSMAKTIQGLGFNDPIEVDKTGTIMCGHGRKMAAIQLGMDEVPVIYMNIAGSDADAYAIVHNSTTLSTGMEMDVAMDVLQAAGMQAEDAALAGISQVEWDLNTGEARDTSSIYFGSDVTDGEAKSLTKTVKRIIMKMKTEAEYDDWMAFMIYLKNKFPSEETMVDRLVRYIEADKKRAAS